MTEFVNKKLDTLMYLHFTYLFWGLYIKPIAYAIYSIVQIMPKEQKKF